MPFLQESGVNLLDLAESNEQVVFTSSELEVPQINVQTVVDAQLLKTDKNSENDKGKEENYLSHELLYGIGSTFASKYYKFSIEKIQKRIL